MARNGPTPKIDSREHDLQSLTPREFNDKLRSEALAMGAVDAEELPSLGDPEIVVVGARFSNDPVAEEEFMNEPVIVTVLSNTNEEHPEDPVPLAVNGRRIFIFRDKPTVIKRKYLERLARAKRVNYSSHEVIRPDGERIIRYPSNASFQYPFIVNKDLNPAGNAWIQKVMRES